MEETDQIEYDITVRFSARSTLNPETLKQMLIVALLNEANESVILDGASPELEVVEYAEICIEEAI